MSDIGEDIKAVFVELAEQINVYDHVSGEIIASEFIDFERDWRIRSTFESEHILTATFPYDTKANVGDRIDFLTTDTKFLLSSLVENVFEREVISKDAFLHKCNKKIMVKRKDENPTRNDNYELEYAWNEIFSGEYALYMGRLAYQETINTEQYARFYKRKKRAYFSKDLDVQPKDCMYIDDELFEVELIEKDHYPGINVCDLLDYNGET